MVSVLIGTWCGGGCGVGRASLASSPERLPAEADQRCSGAAQEEFAKFRVLEDSKPKLVDAHFEAVVEQAKKLVPAKVRKGGAS